MEIFGFMKRWFAFCRNRNPSDSIFRLQRSHGSQKQILMGLNLLTDVTYRVQAVGDMVSFTRGRLEGGNFVDVAVHMVNTTTKFCSCLEFAKRGSCKHFVAAFYFLGQPSAIGLPRTLGAIRPPLPAHHARRRGRPRQTYLRGALVLDF